LKMMQGCFQAVVALALLGNYALAHECAVTDQPEDANALMQRANTAHNMMKAVKTERQKARREHKRQQPKAHVSKKGTINLYLNEMNDIITTHGKTGADPDQIAHIHSIKALIDETILPTVMANIEESRRQLQAAYDEIVACGDKHTLGFNFSTEMTLHPTVVTKETMVDCVKLEDELITWQEEACEQMNRSRLSIYLPDGFDFPPPTVPDEEMIEYLKLMDEFFCGRYEVWHEEYTKCEQYMKNLTNTRMDCKKLHKEYNEQHCSVSTKLDASCGDLDTCYTEGIKDYRELKQSIMELEFERLEEYEGASLIECLWTAWIYEVEPCTVNETRVRECHEYPPNLTNVTIEFPSPPPPPSCGDEAFHAALGTPSADGHVEICSEEWTRATFAELGLHAELIDEIEEACKPCPVNTWTAIPRETGHLNMVNVEHAAGNSFVKTKGGSGCDAYVMSEDYNVHSITITPIDLEQRIQFEILSEDKMQDFIIVMQNSIATVGDGGTSDDVAMYHDGDVLGMQISAGQALFLKNGAVFHTEEIMNGMVTGQGKVTFCAKVGEEVQIDFEILE